LKFIGFKGADQAIFAGSAMIGSRQEFCPAALQNDDKLPVAPGQPLRYDSNLNFFA